MYPDHIATALMPIVADAARLADAGFAVQSALLEATLAGFLTGRGMAPDEALELVRHWRLGAVSEELTGPRYSAVGPDAELRTALEQNIRNEATAAHFYSELLDRAAEPWIRASLEHAIADEQKHYRMLEALYREVTGHIYEAQPQRVEFADLRDGLRRALHDELEAAEAYRDLYLRYRNPRIRDVFFELMTDEMEHATRFTYALQLVG